LVWLHQAFHETDLVKADGQKEARKFGQMFFAQLAAAAMIVSVLPRRL
jgi:hypothetical protein